MKILVTGGTGVVGIGAVPALLRAGHQVRLLTRHAERDAASFPEGVEPFAADIADPTPMRSAVAGCDGVLHIAGIVDEDPPEMTFQKINVDGTWHLLDAAAKSGEPFFIYVSSLGAERGQSDYHRSKRNAEELVRRYTGPWVILRPASVYGPGDETISMLLKMVRTLPVVPMVNDGAQPFQPLWYADLARVITQVMEKPELQGQTFEIAGPDVTTTDEIIRRLAAITGRNPPRLPVPAWLAQMGTQALDAFGAAGKKLIQNAGVGLPINSAKLSMLLEGNVIPDARGNALSETFQVEPTSLDVGLEMLADLLPEQLPGEGIGALQHSTYSAEIHGTNFSAAELIERVGENLVEIMPIEFAAEAGAPDRAAEGATYTAAIKGRGHVQVRLEDRTEQRLTFVTLEGHPLAGVMQLYAEDLADGLRFSVHLAAQPANVIDWVAAKIVGETMQEQNWRGVVQRVVRLSGGNAPAGVQRSTHKMGTQEARDLDVWVQRLVQRQQRTQREVAAAQG
jgi:NADH dehydrogenase